MIDPHSVNETLKHLNLIDIGVRKCPDCGLELPKKQKECEDCGFAQCQCVNDYDEEMGY